MANATTRTKRLNETKMILGPYLPTSPILTMKRTDETKPFQKTVNGLFAAVPGMTVLTALPLLSVCRTVNIRKFTM